MDIIDIRFWKRKNERKKSCRDDFKRFFEIHSSRCIFKTAFFQTLIFKFYLLSPISAILLPTCSTSSFQKLVERVRNYIKEVWLIFKKWVWRVDFERFFLSEFCLVKWAKTNAFSSIGKMKEHCKLWIFWFNSQQLIASHLMR